MLLWKWKGLFSPFVNLDDKNGTRPPAPPHPIKRVSVDTETLSVYFINTEICNMHGFYTNSRQTDTVYIWEKKKDPFNNFFAIRIYCIENVNLETFHRCLRPCEIYFKHIAILKREINAPHIFSLQTPNIPQSFT